MAKILIQPACLTVENVNGLSLDQILKKADVKLKSSCSGIGKCGKCRVIITGGKDAVNPPTAEERKHLTAKELSEGMRLACQVMILGNIEVLIPEASVFSQAQLQLEGPVSPVKLSPLVKRHYLELDKPSLQNPQPDLERLLRFLDKQHSHAIGISFNVLRKLSEVLRKADWKVTATVWDDREILNVEAGDTTGLCYGLAIDVGTTKIACSLVDLNTGETLSTRGNFNPQIAIGEDLMTRITYALKGEKERKELQQKIIDGINCLIDECLLNTNIEIGDVYEAVIVCNTAIHHLLLNIFPKYLALSPYVPAISDSLNLKAGDLNIHINPEAGIHILPAIAGFVGADCVADILATGISRANTPSLLLDIGTNTEIVLGDKNRLLACSCASGPAFEGGHIRHGMQAMRGAIESISITPETYKVNCRTIGNQTPQGICGSGIIDCVAEFLKAGIIDRKGVFKSTSLPGVRINEEGQSEFVLAAGKASNDIVMTQRDISEFQLAKAAVFTGIVLLMQEMNLKPEQLKNIYLAGAFGTHTNPANAIASGILPSFSLGSIKSVGNTAIAGAKMALISGRARKQCKKISQSVRYLELATHPDFHSVFMESLRFPEM